MHQGIDGLAPADRFFGAASEVKKIFETTDGVVDVDWTIEAPQVKQAFRVDRVLAVLDALWDEYREERYRAAPMLRRIAAFHDE